MTRVEFLIVGAAVLQTSISAEAKLVWAAIYFLARPTGYCEVPYQEIGNIVGLDKRAVMRAIPKLTEADLIVSSGGGNGMARQFTIPKALQNLDRFNSGTGLESEPVQKQNRSRTGSGPLPQLNRTTTQTVPLYKEEINNNNKSASDDADTSVNLSKLQEQWFHEEFWPLFWRKRDKAEALKVFKRHATSEAKKNEIIAAVKAELQDMQARQPQHRPYAATWLNKRRYEDDNEAELCSAREQGSLYTAAEENE